MRDYEIWHHFAKLESFGRKISGENKEIFINLSQKHPDWILEGSERDEFSSWFSTSDGRRSDLTIEEMFSLPIKARVSKLLEKGHDFHDGWIDVFREGAKEKTSDVIETLLYLKAEGIWNRDIWHAGLVGISDSGDLSWAKIAPILESAPDEIFQSESWAIAFWVERASKNITPGSNVEDLFWSIFEKLSDFTPQKEEINEKDVIHDAINDSIGILTEALVNRFGQRNIQVGEGIPSQSLLSCLNKIVQSNGNSFLLGRVVLASRIHYFYLIEPEWTRNTFLPLMNWKTSNEAAYIWTGYLRAPKVTVDLGLEIKSQLLVALQKREQLGELAENLHKLFAFICLEYPDLYALDQKISGLRSVGINGLEEIAEFLWHSVSRDQLDKDAYWHNRVKPFIHSLWPKDVTSEKISRSLSLFCLQFGESFDDVFNEIKRVIMPFKDLGLFLHEMKQSQALKEKPKSAFNLLGTVFTGNYEWPDNELREVLDILKGEDSAIVGEQDYKIIDQYLLENRL